MDLSDRKKKILQVVVDDYIADIEPISSKKVQERHLRDLSSATIRSELAALEELGYLGQPHTSAGRVPLSKAYRFYVDRIMELGQLDKKQIAYIEDHFSSSIKNTQELVHSAAKIVTDITNYTAIGTKTEYKKDIIDNIKLVKLSAKTVLVIIVTGDKVLRDSIISTREDINEVYIDTGSEVLQKVFCGKSVESAAKIQTDSIINSQFNIYRTLFQNVIDTLTEYVYSDSGGSVVVEGAQKMLNYPEFTDIEKARKFLSILDAKGKLISLVKSGEPKSVDLSITIGGEREELQDFSMVTAKYSIEGKEVGTAGVLGPVRMEYGKVVSVLECIRDTINNLIK